jgi:sortase A
VEGAYAKLTAVRGLARPLGVLRSAAVVAAGVLVINACGTAHTTTTLDNPVAVVPRIAPPPVPATNAPVLRTPVAPTTSLPLHIPIAIPDDSYADEPIVHYGSIEIPKIGLTHQLFEGVTLNNIDLGPSHWTGTADPGQPGNAVFAGHRVTHDHPFRRLDELAPGDQVVFHVSGVRSVYRVTGSLIVGPDDTWIADQTAAPTATLYACHPPGSATQRIVVRLALVSSGRET